MTLMTKTGLHLPEESKESLLMDSGDFQDGQKDGALGLWGEAEENGLSLEKRQLWWDLTSALQYLWKEHQEYGASLFTEVHEEWKATVIKQSR